MKKFLLILLFAVVSIGGLLYITREVPEVPEENIQPTISGTTRDPKQEAELRKILEGAVLGAITPAVTLSPREAQAFLEYEDNKSGLVRLNLIAEDLDYNIINFSEDMIMIEKRARFGFANMSGEVVVPFIYTEANGFSDGLAAVKNERNKWGFIDKNGEVVIPIIYDRVGNFNDGLAPAAIFDGRKMGVINKNGEIVVPLIYDGVGDFNNGYAVVSQRTGNTFYHGIINKAGELVVPCEYNNIGYTNHESLCIVMGGKGLNIHDNAIFYGLIDARNNNIIVPVKYAEIQPFYNGLAVFLNYDNFRYGVMNTRGETVIPDIHHEFGWRSFENSDVAFVRDPDSRHQRHALINRNGEILTDYVFIVSARVFSEGLAGVYMDNTRGYIDESGEFVIIGEYHDMNRFLQSGVATVTKDPYVWGVIDKTGGIVMPCVYANMLFTDDFIFARRYVNGTWNIYEIEGIR